MVWLETGQWRSLSPLSCRDLFTSIPYFFGVFPSFSKLLQKIYPLLLGYHVIMHQYIFVAFKTVRDQDRRINFRQQNWCLHYCVCIKLHSQSHQPRYLILCVCVCVYLKVSVYDPLLVTVFHCWYNLTETEEESLETIYFFRQNLHYRSCAVSVAPPEAVMFITHLKILNTADFHH